MLSWKGRSLSLVGRMTSSNEIAETTPLLNSLSDSQNGPEQSGQKTSRFRGFPIGAFGHGTSPEGARYVLLFLVPVVLFGVTLASTTSFDIFRLLACMGFYTINDPGHVPGDLEDPRCKAPGVNSWYSGLVIIQSIVAAFGCESHRSNVSAVLM